MMISRGWSFRFSFLRKVLFLFHSLLSPLAPIARCELLAPIARCELLAPIARCQLLAPIARCEPLAPIARCELLAPIARCEPLAPIARCELLAPIARCELLAPIARCEPLAPIARWSCQAILPLRKPANSFCLAACISRAAVVSVCARAWRSRSWIVTSALRCPAKPGNCRRISQGVAYHRYTRFTLPLALATSVGTPHGR